MQGLTIATLLALFDGSLIEGPRPPEDTPVEPAVGPRSIAAGAAECRREMTSVGVRSKEFPPEISV